MVANLRSVLFCRSLWVAKRFAAEPGIRTHRTQGQVLRALFDLDVVDPNRLRPMGSEDLLGQSLLLGRSDADPKDEATCGHEVVEALGLVSLKNPDSQQETGASSNDADDRGGNAGFPATASRKRH